MIRFLLILLFCGQVLAKTPAPKTPPQGVLLYNETTNQILIETNPGYVRPIASITKLMTAMVALDYDKNLTRPLKLVRRSKGSIPKGSYTRGQIIHAMLIRSDNNAAETLATDYPGGRAAFLTAMNRKAVELKMYNTNFDDPSGLDRNNVSTIHNLKLMLQASAQYPLIREISVKKQVMFEKRYKKKIRKINVPNTNNQMLLEFDNIVVSKTGLTNPAGWCVGLVVEQNGQKYIVVILGARNKLERLKIAKEIMYNHLSDTDLK
jgi:D-alanyl-D-alanine endopeptidase (penicillin-binding protein 7)